jgi:hypothetical protein
MVCSFFHLYLARSLLFVDWEVQTVPAGLQMVRHLIVYYAYRDLNYLPQISFTVWQIGGCLHSRDLEDRIYGLLGIQDPEKDIEFEIDLTKSARDVYLDFTHRCIEHGHGLQVLEFIKENETNESQMETKGLEASQMERLQLGETLRIQDQTEESQTEEKLHLPSWVPDWSVEGPTTPLDLSNLVFGKTSRLNAAGSRSYTSSPEFGSKEKLVVKGKIIDYVVREMEHDFQIGTPAKIEQCFAVNFMVRLWVMFIERGIECGLVEETTTEQLQAAIIRTLTADGFNVSNASPELNQTPGGRLSDEDAIEIYHELERLRELSANGLPLPEDLSETKKDMHRGCGPVRRCAEGGGLLFYGNTGLCLDRKMLGNGIILLFSVDQVCRGS